MKSAFIIALTIILSSFITNAQEKIELNERFYLFVDRPCYIAGEAINFKASPNLLNNQAFKSSTYYIDLVNDKGESIEQKKVVISKNGSFGSINIPENANSGFYRLYGYTKWQRNFGVDCFALQDFFILNVNEGINSSTTSKSNSSSSVDRDINLVNDNKSVGYEKEVKTYKLNIKTDKSNYGKREEINLSLSQPNYDLHKNVDFSLSVFKMPITNDSIAYYPNFMSKNISNELIRKKSYFINKEELHFFPETKGSYLAGTILKKDGKTNIKKKINLLVTAFDSARTLKTIWTDRSGRFLINFENHENPGEILIQINEMATSDYQIKLEDEFHVNFPEIKNETLSLNENDKKYLKRLMLNYQINKEYFDSEEEIFDKNEIKDLFYGTHDTCYYLKKYIDLPTMEEVFNNITLGAIAKKKKKIFNLVILDKNNNELLFPALILIDGIPVPDVQKMMKIHPSLVEKIAITHSNYMVGNTFFGGIISIFTKKKDFANITLPKSAKIYEYKTVETQNDLLDTNLQISSVEKNIPAFYNTIKWVSNDSLGSDGKNQIVFNASDEKGKFLIKVVGFSDNKTIFTGETSYEIE